MGSFLASNKAMVVSSESLVIDLMSNMAFVASAALDFTCNLYDLAMVLGSVLGIYKRSLIQEVLLLGISCLPLFLQCCCERSPLRFPVN